MSLKRLQTMQKKLRRNSTGNLRKVGRVSKLIDNCWTRCVELGLDVVLDLGFWSPCRRDEVRATAVALRTGVRLYRLECPEDEAWRRIEKRNLHLDGSLLIVRNTFDMLKSRFEPLGDDEERIEV
jgi:predicted kinase